jgi:molecular chaperone Hsp33
MSELTKFLFEGLPVRGVLVRLTDAWQEVLRRRQTVGAHPPEVRVLLGEMAAAGVLMQANIKFNGAVVLQVFGDGPVKLAVAEVQPDLAFRATATVVGEVPVGAQVEAMLNVRGQGRCAITLDPRDRLPGQQPYQGVVPLHGDQREPLQQVQQVLEHYMLQSEQLDTRLLLAANDEVAAGLLMREELLSLDTPQILHRLFWEETVRVFEPEAPRFACTCSRERVAGMLRGLGREESDSLIVERGLVEVGCEFCGLQYRFDAVDVGEMFTPARDQPPASGAVQ